MGEQQVSMTVKTTSDVNLLALNQMLAQRSGLFLVRVHNYRVEKIARVEREMPVRELLIVACEPSVTERAG